MTLPWQPSPVQHELLYDSYQMKPAHMSRFSQQSARHSSASIRPGSAPPHSAAGVTVVRSLDRVRDLVASNNNNNKSNNKSKSSAPLEVFVTSRTAADDA